jgi:ribosomal 30S subunit maturation factor RimM
MTQTISVNVGDQVYLKDGGEEIGAVREVYRERKELVLYVENSGEFTIPWAAIRATHSQKVILDVKKLDGTLRKAIGHAHDREEF